MAMKNTCYEPPKNNKEVFADPEISRIPGVTLENKENLQRCRIIINGISFQTLRDKTREELLHSAVQYTNRIRSLLQKEPYGQRFTYESVKNIPIIQTGHEPVFYHPGIWVKNHLTHHIAENVGGVGINMIVDNDACTMGFIYAPALSENSLRIQKIPLVEGKDQVAYEDVVFDDCKVLFRFRNEVIALLKNNASHADALSGKPVGKDTTTLTLSKGIKTTMDDMRVAFEGYIARIAECYERGCVDMVGLLTAARDAVEEDFQIDNLEIPVSRMCNTDGFCHFFLHILHNAERFARIYNEKLAEYRSIHKIKSKVNPMPDLSTGDNAIELPFWIWKLGGERGRCYLQTEDNSLKITDGTRVVAILGKNEGGTENVQRLRALTDDLIKLRPRAITTTMFSRLFFSDVFIHGIGGAKYDTITDEIIREFFGISPPSYVTHSATLYLPLNAFDTDTGKLQRLQRELRDMPHNPERYAPKEMLSDAGFANLVERKKGFLTTMADCSMDNRKAYFNQVRELNKLMLDKIRAEFLHKQNELNAMVDGLARENAVKFREYPVCIFPIKFLRGHYTNVFSAG